MELRKEVLFPLTILLKTQIKQKVKKIVNQTFLQKQNLLEIKRQLRHYKHVICSIENDKARVIIKGKDKLTDKETRDIKNVVMSISNIQEVEIETKQ